MTCHLSPASPPFPNSLDVITFHAPEGITSARSHAAHASSDHSDFTCVISDNAFRRSALSTTPFFPSFLSFSRLISSAKNNPGASDLCGKASHSAHFKSSDERIRVLKSVTMTALKYPGMSRTLSLQMRRSSANTSASLQPLSTKL